MKRIGLLPNSEREWSWTDRPRFRSRKQSVERSRFACPMEIGWPGAKAQAKERGGVGTWRGWLDGVGTIGAWCLGRGGRPIPDPGRTLPRPPEPRGWDAADRSRLESHHEGTGAGGGLARNVAQGTTPWIRRMMPSLQLGQRRTAGSYGSIPAEGSSMGSRSFRPPSSSLHQASFRSRWMLAMSP